MHYNALVLSVVTFVYGLAAVLYVFSWAFRKKMPGKLATWVTLAACLGNAAGLALRWYESYQIGGGYGHAPLSNIYESLTFFALTIGTIDLVIERRYGNRAIGVFALPLAFFALAYASFGTNDRIQPLIPALKSNWLIAHVISCFIGYAAFGVAFCVSIMYLFKADRSRDEGNRILSRMPDVAILDELTHQLIMFGFLFLTVGIVTGAVWANSAWGALLGVGSQGDLVFYHLVDLRRPAALSNDARLARKTHRRAFHRGIRCSPVYLFWRQPVARPA
jgi:cytochrome c-type biogenesis protein CcsB